MPTADRTRAPSIESLVIHVDGGARGNPGPAGIGVVVSDSDGNELLRANDYIGEATNNVAEYRALLMGLARARTLGTRKVEVINDSELVARQLKGEYKVKHPGLRPLYDATIAALGEFDHWSIRSVSRAKNRVADRLVNEAIDARSSTTT